jgi:hypothetical protein
LCFIGAVSPASSTSLSASPINSAEKIKGAVIKAQDLHLAAARNFRCNILLKVLPKVILRFEQRAPDAIFHVIRSLQF